MVSFWGGKKNDSDRPEEPSREQEENENAPGQSHEEEPTERTRLIPRNEGQSFLSPDDPAVC